MRARRTGHLRRAENDPFDAERQTIMPDILLTDVGKAFPGGAVGLHPTTLRVRAGEHFVLLGPSGAGKTTLLRLIAGLETPDGGSITFDGHPVHPLPPHRRGVSFV